MTISAHRSPRIVITGAGAITNLGLSAKETWEGMRAGRSGITVLEGEEFSRFGENAFDIRIAGQVKNFDPAKFLDVREARRVDRFCQMGLAAAIEAVNHAGIDFSKQNPERCGVIIGSGIGGITTMEECAHVIRDRGPSRANPFTVPKLMANAAAGNISIRFGLQGPASTHATACASSGHAFGDAVHSMRRGETDVMIAGGAEATIGPVCVAAFNSMKALSARNDAPSKASRPFDKDRDGFVLGEGAAMFILETEEHARKRGAKILGEIVGVANSCDAYHITAPDEAGQGAVRSMKWALRDAGLNLDQIDYINAHGTSTPLGDKAEVAAVLSLFGNHARKSAGGKCMMSSTKSMHGHALGASGAVETIACLHAVADGIIPPTINLENPDEGMDVDLVPNHARERRIKYAMNNTFGFGGHNCTIVIGRYDG